MLGTLDMFNITYSLSRRQSIKEEFNPSNLNIYTSLFPTTPYINLLRGHYDDDVFASIISLLLFCRRSSPDWVYQKLLPTASIFLKPWNIILVRKHAISVNDFHLKIRIYILHWLFEYDCKIISINMENKEF